MMPFVVVCSVISSRLSEGAGEWLISAEIQMGLALVLAV